MMKFPKFPKLKFIHFCHGRIFGILAARRAKQPQVDECASAGRKVDWIKSVSVTHTSLAKNENENWKWRTDWKVVRVFAWLRGQKFIKFKVVSLLFTTESFSSISFSFSLLIELSSWWQQMLDDFRKHLCKWYTLLFQLFVFLLIKQILL